MVTFECLTGTFLPATVTEGSFTLEMLSMTSEICLEMYRNLEIKKYVQNEI